MKDKGMTFKRKIKNFFRILPLDGSLEYKVYLLTQEDSWELIFSKVKCYPPDGGCTTWLTMKHKSGMEFVYISEEYLGVIMDKNEIEIKRYSCFNSFIKKYKHMHYSLAFASEIQKKKQEKENKLKVTSDVMDI